MTPFRRVTPEFAVAAQLTPQDVARAAAEGFRTLVNNRPDGETPGQMTASEAEEAARQAGLAYRSIAFSGPPPPGAIAETEEFLAQAQGPVLAFCRTGTRSVTVWAMAQALAGARPPDEIVALAAEAGYDLAGARGALISLYPK